MKKNLPLLLLATTVMAIAAAEFWSPIAQPRGYYVGYAIGWGLICLAVTFVISGSIASGYRFVKGVGLGRFWRLAWIVWVVVTALVVLGSLQLRARSVEQFLSGR